MIFIFTHDNHNDIYCSTRYHFISYPKIAFCPSIIRTKGYFIYGGLTKEKDYITEDSTLLVLHLPASESLRLLQATSLDSDSHVLLIRRLHAV